MISALERLRQEKRCEFRLAGDAYSKLLWATEGTVSKGVKGAEDVAPLVERLPATHQALGSVPSTT